MQQQYIITQEEVLRFLVKTDGYIAAPAIAAKQAKVYGNAPGVEMAAYNIPHDMFKKLIAEELVSPQTGTSGGSQRFKLTDKGVRKVSRLRGEGPEQAGDSA